MTAVDGGGRVDTLVSLGPRKFPMSWAPDGRALSYTLGGGPTSRDIGVIIVEGGVREVGVVETPFADRGGMFSPDGAWLAYVSDKSGQRDEIYARPYPGPGSEVLVSVSGGTEPVWSRSGAELYYRDADGILAVPVERRGSGLSVGTPRRVMDDIYRRDNSGGAGGYPNYDVAANGDVLVVEEIPPVEDGSSARGLVIVLNWFEELRARVPN
jgi:hypothetical protein